MKLDIVQVYLPLIMSQSGTPDCTKLPVFTSYDLAQGYLQMLMEEAGIKKTAFKAGSSSLYEFAHMPFGLSNFRSGFCCLMEMCLGNQQSVTVLLYLEDIHTSVVNIDEMLDQIKMVL